MSISITFQKGHKFQDFALSVESGQLSFTRLSHASTTSRWVRFTTSAYVTTHGTVPGARRDASEHLNFSFGKSSEKYSRKAVTTQWAYDYSIEEELDALHGDGFYDLEADTDYDCWGKIPSRTQAHVPPF